MLRLFTNYNLQTFILYYIHKFSYFQESFLVNQFIFSEIFSLSLGLLNLYSYKTSSVS